ncbi:hypothetical protein NDU88_000227 [Pleurodeles waltl]|uniref:Uncharacterized protein n=1 Tax=Pleurodeles waltl TaxID=8319 RepID=A0AAV7S692_PLEWA|nr:hypothetical protein NDU88_000227 [Pleurodeles waltl]
MLAKRIRQREVESEIAAVVDRQVWAAYKARTSASAQPEHGCAASRSNEPQNTFIISDKRGRLPATERPGRVYRNGGAKAKIRKERARKGTGSGVIH